MLEGETVNLRLMKRQDLPLVDEWVNNPDFTGKYEPISQETLTETQRMYDDLSDGQWYFVEKKDGTRIGYIAHYLAQGKLRELGYSLAPAERGKGYGSEAIKIVVDFLFLSKSILRIQAKTDPGNLASQGALRKAGFRKEAMIRRSFFCRGEWRDTALYSILRDEWGGSRIL